MKIPVWWEIALVFVAHISPQIWETGSLGWIWSLEAGPGALQCRGEKPCGLCWDSVALCVLGQCLHTDYPRAKDTNLPTVQGSWLPECLLEQLAAMYDISVALYRAELHWSHGPGMLASIGLQQLTELGKNARSILETSCVSISKIFS